MPLILLTCISVLMLIIVRVFVVNLPYLICIKRRDILSTAYGGHNARIERLLFYQTDKICIQIRNLAVPHNILHKVYLLFYYR